MMSILNISAYRFVPIEQPEVLAEHCRLFLQKTAILGTVLLAPEGINLFLAGPESDIRYFCDFLEADSRFHHMRCKESWSEHIPFERLLVKCKPEIIRMNTPYDASLFSPLLPAKTLCVWLDQGCDGEGHPLLLLDTRNAFEYHYGHFEGAVHLDLLAFSEFPERLPQLISHLDKTVVSYCTGGVRCEKVGAALRACGFERVYQLDGGILRYFEEVGGEHYIGSCFVFDQRRCLGSDLLPVSTDSGVTV